MPAKFTEYLSLSVMYQNEISIVSTLYKTKWASIKFRPEAWLSERIGEFNVFV